MKIAVVGTGYVGLVAGVGFADAGHKVHCVDKDSSKIERLQRGEVPIYEPGLENILETAKDRLVFTTDLDLAVKESEIIFIAVGTPSRADGHADLEPTLQVVEQIARAADGPKYVVLKSTVPVGTHKTVMEIFEKGSPHPIEVINNPEFLKEGTAIDDFLRPDRVVIGCQSEKAAQVMQELYSPFVKNGHPIFVMDNTSAELTKYAANAFLSLKISFINELARLADQVGADIDQVRKGFTSDSRINPKFFYPGVGFGGSCFPKDIRELIQLGNSNRSPMNIVEAAYQVNEDQKRMPFEKLKKLLGELEGKSIAIWGLSFKPRTDDMREAPSLVLIDQLHHAGAQVRAYDPVAGPNAQALMGDKFTLMNDKMAAAQGAHALVILTEWNEFQNPPLLQLREALKTPVVLDGRNVLDPAHMKAMGFKYTCMGRDSVGGVNG